MKEIEIIKNLEKCPSFEHCSQNLCPLDLRLELRTGSDRDKCRYMKESQRTKIKGKVFISFGKIMPDELLKFVPERNLKWLNNISRQRWKELRDNFDFKVL